MQEINREIHKRRPSIWAEELLKITLDDWQVQFLESPKKRKILNIHRQAGKSAMSSMKCLHTAIFKPGSLSLIIAPSLRQSQENFISIKKAIDLIPNPPVFDTFTKLGLSTADGSRILCLPGGNEGTTIRGFAKPDIIIEDEASRCSDDLHQAILPMMTANPDCEFIMASTPHGPQGHFYQTWISDLPNWQKIKLKASDNPRISKEFLEEQKHGPNGMRYYLQEFECAFVSVADARMKREWLKYEDHPPAGLCPGSLSPGHRIAMGVDLAISEKATADYTAICVLGRDVSGCLHVLDVERIRGSFQQQIDLIKQKAAKWQPSVVGIEDVQYQRVMVQQISAQTSLNVRGIRPDKDKVSRFAPLEGRYELGQIYHVRGLDPAFEAELLSFPMGAHDDQVDAMSIAFEALNHQEPPKTMLTFSTTPMARSYNKIF